MFITTAWMYHFKLSHCKSHQGSESDWPFDCISLTVLRQESVVPAWSIFSNIQVAERFFFFSEYSVSLTSPVPEGHKEKGISLH